MGLQKIFTNSTLDVGYQARGLRAYSKLDVVCSASFRVCIERRTGLLGLPR